MKIVWNWIKKHWIISLVILFIFFVLILLPAILYQPSVDGKNSDLLGYWGTCVAALGTVVLGTATVWQTYSSIQNTKKYQKMLEQQEIKANMPIIMCNSIFLLKKIQRANMIVYIFEFLTNH